LIRKKQVPNRVSLLGSSRQLGNEEEIKRAQIYFGACYMSFYVRLWHNITQTNWTFHKGMRHIIFDDIMSNIEVFPIYALRFSISLAPARWQSSSKVTCKQWLTDEL